MKTLALPCARLLPCVLTATVCTALVSCDTRPLGRPTTQPESIIKIPVRQKLAYDLDVLFVIDNSPSMAPKQNNVRANFPVLIDELKKLPNGLPNVHIAVATTDLGSGTAGPCKPLGQGGVFRFAPGVTAGKNPTPLPCKTINEGTFISALDHGAETNFDGDISDVFSCMAAVGEAGCGFEQPLLSAAVALGYWNGGELPVENTGFLRPDALLAIVFLTDEDDCSVPADSILFDRTATRLDSTFGPLQSYRCNEFGHLCGGQRPPRTGTEPVSFDVEDCHADESDQRALTSVTEIATYIKSLKKDPNRIFVAAITGVPASYTVAFVTPDTPQLDPLWPKIEPTCRNASDAAVTADPAVRIRDFVRQFGNNGLMESICADSFAPAMDRIAGALKQRLNPGCLTQRPTRDLSCVVTDHLRLETGGYAPQMVPRCNAGDIMSADGAPTCWYLAANADCKATGLELKVSRGDHDIPVDSYSEIQCVACNPGATDCF